MSLNKKLFNKRRIARITLGAVLGASLGWALAGTTTPTLASTLPHTSKISTDAASLNSANPALKLKPDPQARWIAGHLIAALSIIGFAGLVVAVLAPDGSKEPMARAAEQDNTTHPH